IIDSSIHFDPHQLNAHQLERLLNRLRVPNPAKKIAEKEMLRNASNVPSHITLWNYNGHNEIIFPRGFVWEMEKILGENDVDIKWVDRIPKLDWVEHSDRVIDLRPYQSEAFHKLWSMNGGIYKAPTGSGKTRVMLELVRQLKHKTIVFVEK